MQSDKNDLWYFFLSVINETILSHNNNLSDFNAI